MGCHGGPEIPLPLLPCPHTLPCPYQMEMGAVGEEVVLVSEPGLHSRELFSGLRDTHSAGFTSGGVLASRSISKNSLARQAQS